MSTWLDDGTQWVNLSTGDTDPGADEPAQGPTRPMPIVASWDFANAPYTTETALQTYDRLEGYGYNGWTVYSGTSVGWNGSMASVASAHANDPVNLQVAPKQVVANDIRAICNNLPVAWRPGFRWNYFQEPEDNHTTSGEIAGYRAKVSEAAVIFREYPWAQLPWLELAQYWAATDPAHTAEFIPPAEDFGGILWSFFEYQENISLTRLQGLVDSVSNFMATYAPGKPWEIMGCCYNLEPINGPFTQTQYNNQATWLTESYTRLRAAGCIGYAWYNVKFGTSGGASGESRIEVNPAGLAAMQAIAAAGHTVPVLVGNGGVMP